MCRLCTNPHNVLSTRAARERDGYPQVCYPSPSFSLHRAPAAAAAFRSATARRAALSAEMRVSFSPAGRKRNGGRIPFPERKNPPPPKGAHPRFPEREKLTPRQGANPTPHQGELSHSLEREKLTPPTGPHSPQRGGKNAPPTRQPRCSGAKPIHFIIYCIINTASIPSQRIKLVIIWGSYSGACTPARWAAWRHLSIQAMFLPRVRMVCMPSRSCTTSSAVLPCT